MIASDIEEIRALMMTGFEQAFIAQIGQLYKVYMANVPTVKEQQEYTKRGIEAAVAAYRLAMSAVEDWEG
jgi:hypothetical protein